MTPNSHITQVSGATEASTAEHEAHPGGERPISRAEVRRRLRVLLRTDSDLDSFLIDSYPQVYSLLSRGMNRDEKINILFQHINAEEISVSLNKWRTIYLSKSEDNIDEYMFDCVINISYLQKNQAKIEAILAHMRKMCNDIDITIIATRPGSVIVTLKAKWNVYLEIEKQSRNSGGLFLGGLEIKSAHLVSRDTMHRRLLIRMDSIMCAIEFWVVSRWKAYLKQININTSLVSAFLHVPRWVTISIIIILLGGLSFAATKAAPAVAKAAIILKKETGTAINKLRKRFGRSAWKKMSESSMLIGANDREFQNFTYFGRSTLYRYHFIPKESASADRNIYSIQAPLLGKMNSLLVWSNSKKYLIDKQPVRIGDAYYTLCNDHAKKPKSWRCQELTEKAKRMAILSNAAPITDASWQESREICNYMGKELPSIDLLLDAAPLLKLGKPEKNEWATFQRKNALSGVYGNPNSIDSFEPEADASGQSDTRFRCAKIIRK